MNKPQKLKGFRDYLPEQALLRRRIIDTLYTQAAIAGFLPIDTPSLEYAETLLGQGGNETDKEVYSFVDHGDRKVALRFDLTVPFARFMAENRATFAMPFKRVQVGEVWRGEKPQKGRYRQFAQGDVDIVGVDSLAADVDVLLLLIRVLAITAAPITVSLGNRELLSALIQNFLPSVSDEAKILIAIDKLQKIGRDKVAELIDDLPSATAEGTSGLLEAVCDPNPLASGKLKKIFANFSNDKQVALTRFKETIKILQELTPDTVTIRPDLSIARGLGYYTGIVFETTIDKLPGFGSIASGGRYNGLVERFSRESLPGVGGSIGIDRLLAAMEELGANKSGERDQNVFVAVAAEEARLYAFQIVEQLRQLGINADIALKPGKLANQFKYADKQAFALVITVGDEELKAQTFNIKKLVDGSELNQVAFKDLQATVRKQLG